MRSGTKINKATLLEIVKKNREEHRGVFLEAQKGYRAAVISELEKMLESARSGSKVRTSISLQAPIDQTTNYDSIIRMLGLHTDEIVELSDQEFQQFVEDKWSWTHGFANTAVQYSTLNAKYSGYVDQ